MSSVKKNFSYNLIYQFLSIGSVLVVTPYVNRVLGAHLTGVYSFTFANAHYFLLFAMLGLNNYGSRAIAQVKAKTCHEGVSAQDAPATKEAVSKTFWSIYAMQLMNAVLVLIGYAGYSLLLPVDDRKIVLLQSLYVLSALLDVNWFFFGMEKFKLTAIRNSLVKICSVLAIFLFVQCKEDLWIYTVIMSGSFLASAMVLWGYILKNVPFIRPTWKEIAVHIKPNLVLFIPVVAISLYNVMDKIMIGRILRDKAEVSFYDNAYRVMEIPNVFINALGVVMLPRMTALLQMGEEKTGREYIEKSMYFTLYLAIPISCGLAAIANCLAPVYFGTEFAVCGLLMQGLAPIGIIKSWANVIRTQYLLPNKKDRVYVISVVMGAGVNIVANLLLIPLIGTFGAVVGTLVAEAMVMLVQTVYAAKVLPVGKYILSSLPYFILGLAMTVFVWWIGKSLPLSIVTIVIQIVAGVVVYGVPALLLGYRYVKKKG